MTMNKLKNIESALKRAKAMGQPHAWRADFDNHPMAASVANYSWLIEESSLLTSEIDLKQKHLVHLHWTHKMALVINKFCDEAKIKGDAAAEYWLELFLWKQHVHGFADMFLGHPD